MHWLLKCNLNSAQNRAMYYHHYIPWGFIGKSVRRKHLSTCQLTEYYCRSLGTFKATKCETLPQSISEWEYQMLPLTCTYTVFYIWWPGIKISLCSIKIFTYHNKKMLTAAVTKNIWNTQLEWTVHLQLRHWKKTRGPWWSRITHLSTKQTTFSNWRFVCA